MRNYIDILAEIFTIHQKNLESGSNRLSDNIEKFIVWIISLSTGSIALLFLAIDKIDLITQENFILTILFLILSIITGVVGKSLSAISSYIGYQLNSMFALRLKMIDISFKQRKLKGDETAEIIYLYIIEDFNAEFPTILENTKSLKGDELEKYHVQIRKFYLEFSEAKKKDMESALKVINEIMLDSFGFKKNYFDKQKNTSNRTRGIIMRICTKGSSFFYLFSMLNFLVAIVYISIKYYCEL